MEEGERKGEMRKIIESMAMYSIVLLILLFGGIEGRAAGVDLPSPANIVALQEQQGIEGMESEGVEEEEPIMTIGYTSQRYRTDPILRNRAPGNSAVPPANSAGGTAVKILAGLLMIILAVALVVLFVALVLPPILN